jgi:tetratricopeptide (TPR) repeat protein
MQGIKILNDWIAKNPANPLASRAYQSMAAAYLYPLEDYPAALKALYSAAQYPVPKDITGAGLLYQVAYIAHRKANQPELAVEYYTRLLTEIPWDERVPECRRAYKELTGHEFKPQPIATQPTTQPTQPKEAQP